VVDRMLDVAARHLDGHPDLALGELFDRRLHRTAIVPAVPRAAAPPGGLPFSVRKRSLPTRLEEPDDQQDDEDQKKYPTTDIHLALLSLDAGKALLPLSYPLEGVFTRGYSHGLRPGARRPASTRGCGREDLNL
jgi:hypothetical protein